MAVLASIIRSGQSFSAIHSLSQQQNQNTALRMTATSAAAAPAWTDLQSTIGETSVGKALNTEVELRSQGKGSAHVQNKLRLFDSSDSDPPITLYRDHAGEFA